MILQLIYENTCAPDFIRFLMDNWLQSLRILLIWFCVHVCTCIYVWWTSYEASDWLRETRWPQYTLCTLFFWLFFISQVESSARGTLTDRPELRPRLQRSTCSFEHIDLKVACIDAFNIPQVNQDGIIIYNEMLESNHVREFFWNSYPYRSPLFQLHKLGRTHGSTSSFRTGSLKALHTIR